MLFSPRRCLEVPTPSPAPRPRGRRAPLAHRLTPLALAAVLAAASSLAACSVDEVEFVPPVLFVAQIQSFTASDPVLVRGASTTLIAQFEGLSARIDQGVGPVVSGQPVTVTPEASVLYTLTVMGDEGSVTASTSVEVFSNIIEVTTTAPEGPGSLYDAVTLANRADEPVAITFNLPLPATIVPADTLVLSPAAPVAMIGPGPGADQLILDGANQRRLLFVRSGTVSLRTMTLTRGLGAGGRGGFSPGAGSGGGAAGMGGAIFINDATVALRDVVLAANVARGGTAGPVNAGGGFSNGGGGGGFGGDGLDGGGAVEQGGRGGDGGLLGGTGGLPGGIASGDGAGGGGGGAGQTHDGAAGTFGAGGGGAGGRPGSGPGGFGGGAGGGINPVPGMFGGTAVQRVGGGGAGLGGAIFLRAGALIVTDSAFLDNSSLFGPSPAGAAAHGKAKAGAIFSMVPTVTLTDVTYAGSVAVDALDTTTDNADLFIMP